MAEVKSIMGYTIKDETARNSLSDLETRVAALEYNPIVINTFTASPSTIIIGTSNTITLKWTTSGGEGTVEYSVNGSDKQTSTSMTVSDVTSKTTFTLSASDENESVDAVTKTVTVNAYNAVYYGGAVEPDEYTEDFLSSLTAKAQSSNTYSGDWTLAEGEYGYWVTPYANPTFYAGGFETGFLNVATLNITNAAGTAVTYYVYRTPYAYGTTISIVIS